MATLPRPLVALVVALSCACANFDRRLDGGADAPGADLPPAPPRALTGVTHVRAGRWHTCAVDGAGAVWCWGRSDSTQTGVAVTRTCAEGPCVPEATRVADVRDVVELGGGALSTCARDRGGRVFCWGDNTYGQVGVAGAQRFASPTPVPTLPALRALAVGGAHACGVAAGDGAVWCWGYGEIGQFGDGARPMSPRPVTRVAGIAGTLALGDAHGCAYGAGATLRCWGATAAGQAGTAPGETCTATALGAWPARCVTSPVALPAFPVPVAEVAAGYYHTCARLTDGAVWCWGSHEHGQLGGAAGGVSCVVPSDSQASRSVSCSAAAVRVAELPAAERIWTGMRASHTCARVRDGTVRCWGDNRAGQLGDGTRASSQTPRAPRDLGAVTDLALGEDHTCAVVAGGRVRCWGGDGHGQLGDGEGATTGAAYVLQAP